MVLKRKVTKTGVILKLNVWWAHTTETDRPLGLNGDQCCPIRQLPIVPSSQPLLFLKKMMLLHTNNFCLRKERRYVPIVQEERQLVGPCLAGQSTGKSLPPPPAKTERRKKQIEPMEAGVGLGSRLAALQNNNDWKALHAFLWLWWILEASKLTTLVVFEQM